MKRRLITLPWIGFIPFLIFTPRLILAQFTNAALDSLLRELSRVSSDTVHIRIQLQMATIAWHRAYNEQALKYAKEALSNATQINNESLRVDAHRLMGIAYTNKGEYDNYELAQSIYVNLPVIDTLNLARTLNNIGLLAVLLPRLQLREFTILSARPAFA